MGWLIIGSDIQKDADCWKKKLDLKKHNSCSDAAWPLQSN